MRARYAASGEVMDAHWRGRRGIASAWPLCRAVAACLFGPGPQVTGWGMMDDIAAPAVHSKHIVDVLIEERAPHLSNGPLWPVLRPILYAVLNYDKARAM